MPPAFTGIPPILPAKIKLSSTVIVFPSEVNTGIPPAPPAVIGSPFDVSCTPPAPPTNTPVPSVILDTGPMTG